MKLDEGDVACLARDALVEGLNLQRWLLTWVTVGKKKQKKMLRDLHKHDGSSRNWEMVR